MSEAILAFQSQLSGVMESVLKAAMYEIVRLVEDSFLEEVSRSRQQVESLKKRLQWSEGRRKEREADGRSRCADCGRAGVCSEDGSMETELGSEEGHSLKQENVLEGNWSGCPRDTVDPVPCTETEESAAVSPTKAPEPADLVDVGRDSALKVEDLLAAPCSVRLQENCGVRVRLQENCGVRVRLQENCGVCVVGELPKGVSGASTLDHHKGLQHCDKEPSSAVRHALQSSSTDLAVQDESEQSVSRLYSQEPGSGHERLGLTGAQGCVVDLDGEDKTHERVGQLRPAFSRGSGDFRTVRAEPEPGGSGMSSPDVKLHISLEDFLCIKQEEEEEEDEEEMVPAFGEKTGLEITDAPQTHRQDSGTRADVQTENAYELSPQEVLKLHGACSEGGSLALLSGRSLREAVSDATVESNLDKGSCVSYDKCFVMSKNTQGHHSVCTIEKRFGSIHFGKSFTQLINVKTQLKQHTEKSPLGCTQCGKTFSHLCHLKAHQQTHTGERPFICTLCGRSFTKLSNLKAHRRVHTGERPYICTDCGKRFTQKCNLKRHQRIHAAERLLSCK